MYLLHLISHLEKRRAKAHSSVITVNLGPEVLFTHWMPCQEGSSSLLFWLSMNGERQLSSDAVPT